MVSLLGVFETYGVIHLGAYGQLHECVNYGSSDIDIQSYANLWAEIKIEFTNYRNYNLFHIQLIMPTQLSKLFTLYAVIYVMLTRRQI